MNTRILSFGLTIVASFLIYGCNDCNGLSDAERNDVIKEVRQLMEDYKSIPVDFVAQAIDMRAEVEGFTKAVNGKIVATSYATVREQIEPYRENGTKLIFREIRDIHIYPLSKSAASCTFIFSETLVIPNDSMGVNDTTSYGGNWTYVFKKFDGKWKAVQESGSIQYF
jgi:hypothetical protein